jgi:hypothetical protein
VVAVAELNHKFKKHFAMPSRMRDAGRWLSISMSYTGFNFKELGCFYKQPLRHFLPKEKRRGEALQ